MQNCFFKGAPVSAYAISLNPLGLLGSAHKVESEEVQMEIKLSPFSSPRAYPVPFPSRDLLGISEGQLI